VYDSGDGMFAARLWWALLVHGHPQPLILEGGWAQWRAEGRQSELYEPCTLKVRGHAEVWGWKRTHLLPPPLLSQLPLLPLLQQTCGSSSCAVPPGSVRPTQLALAPYSLHVMHPIHVSWSQAMQLTGHNNGRTLLACACTFATRLADSTATNILAFLVGRWGLQAV
jgi:hypothetical protein